MSKAGKKARSRPRRAARKRTKQPGNPHEPLQRLPSHHAVYLTVSGAADAIAFYQAALGATERYRLVNRHNGTIGHCEMSLMGQVFKVADEWPGMTSSPRTLGGTSVTMVLMVPDTDAVSAQAIAAGGTEIMPPTDMFYGCRSAKVRDPFGHECLVQHRIDEVDTDEMQRHWDAMLGECGGGE